MYGFDESVDDIVVLVVVMVVVYCGMINCSGDDLICDCVSICCICFGSGFFKIGEGVLCVFCS